MIKKIIRVAGVVHGKVKYLCELADGSLVEKFISEIVAAFGGGE